MAEPTCKSLGINALISELMGKDREQIIRDDKCITCGGDARDFRDAMSVKEYSISGMCQDCQDKVFE